MPLSHITHVDDSRRALLLDVCDQGLHNVRHVVVVLLHVPGVEGWCHSLRSPQAIDQDTLSAYSSSKAIQGHKKYIVTAAELCPFDTQPTICNALRVSFLGRVYTNQTPPSSPSARFATSFPFYNRRQSFYTSSDEASRSFIITNVISVGMVIRARAWTAWGGTLPQHKHAGQALATIPHHAMH